MRDERWHPHAHSTLSRKINAWYAFNAQVECDRIELDGNVGLESEGMKSKERDQRFLRKRTASWAQVVKVVAKAPRLPRYEQRIRKYAKRRIEVGQAADSKSAKALDVEGLSAGVSAQRPSYESINKHLTSTLERHLNHQWPL